MGRFLLNAIYNLDLKDSYAEAAKELGYDLETTVSQERDASLGNGGLGRLAACFLDSMATLSLPAWGYGIRYRYGMFKQGLDSELKQKEMPDIWLTNGTPQALSNLGHRYPSLATCTHYLMCVRFLSKIQTLQSYPPFPTVTASCFLAR
jgi:starch phosphorylase